MKILSWNIKMLPWIATGKSIDFKRLEAIIQEILHLNPDVVGLQEVFSEDARGMLSKELEKHYPHRIEKSDTWGPNEDSGLFFASKVRIVNKRFETFRSNSTIGADFWANKGVLTAVLDAKPDMPGGSLAVLLTHLQSGQSVSHSKLRRVQLELIRKQAARIAERWTLVPSIILIGDLNIIGEVGGTPTVEYGSALDALGQPRDLFREAHPTDPGFTWDAEDNTNMIPASDITARYQLDRSSRT